MRAFAFVPALLSLPALFLAGGAMVDYAPVELVADVQIREVLVLDYASQQHRWQRAEVHHSEHGAVSDPHALQVVIGPQGVRCNCEHVLSATEIFAWPDPVMDGLQQRRSMQNNDLYPLHEIRDYPLHNEELAAHYLTRAASIRHEGALRKALARGGFEPVQLHGFATDQAEVIGGVHVLHVRQTSTGRTFVAARGTATQADVLRDIDARLLPNPSVPGRVHQGFWSGAVAIDDALGPLPPDTIFTGHSLGAALATLTFVRRRAQVPEGQVITFAPPVLGDRAFHRFVKGYHDQMVAFVVPGEELTGSGEHLLGEIGQWPGQRVQLPHSRRAGGSAHLPVNYSEAMLRRHQLDADRWLDALPLCVSERTGCVDGDPLLHMPQCATYAADCLERAKPEVQRVGQLDRQKLLARYITGQAYERGLLLRALAWKSRAHGNEDDAMRYDQARKAGPQSRP